MNQMIVDAQPDFYKEIPVLKYGQPEDAAELVAFLASPAAGHITGEVIILDGGLSLANPINRFTAKLVGLP